MKMESLKIYKALYKFLKSTNSILQRQKVKHSKASLSKGQYCQLSKPRRNIAKTRFEHRTFLIFVFFIYRFSISERKKERKKKKFNRSRIGPAYVQSLVTPANCADWSSNHITLPYPTIQQDLVFKPYKTDLQK